MYPCVYLCIHSSTYTPTNIPTYLSEVHYFRFQRCFYPGLNLPNSFSSVYPFMHPPVYLCIHTSTYPSTEIPTYLSVYISILLPINLPTRLSDFKSIGFSSSFHRVPQTAIYSTTLTLFACLPVNCLPPCLSVC